MGAAPLAAAGLAFALALSGGGKSVSSDRFTLRVPGARGALVLSFEGLDLTGGALIAPVRLANETDADVLAARIDLVSVTETLREDGGKGESSHPIEAAAGAPPAWDLVRKGTEAASRLFRASPVAFSPETTLIVVLGRVSGVLDAGSFEVEGARNPTDLAVDEGGTAHVADASGRMFRRAPDGRTSAEARWPAPRAGDAREEACAAHRAAGRVCRVSEGKAWVIEGRDVSAFDGEGRRLRTFSPGGEGPPVALTFGRDGRLYVATAGDAERSGSVRVFRPF